MIKMKRYNLDEKLMEVPKDLLKDIEDWLTKVFSSQFIYLCNNELNNKLDFHKKKYPQFDWDKRCQKIELTKKYLKKYSDSKMEISFMKGKGFSGRFDLTKYYSKYGKMNTYKDFISIKYKKADLHSIAFFNPKDKNIYLNSSTISHTLTRILNCPVTSFNFYISPVKSPEEEYAWLQWDPERADKLLKLVVKSASRVLEHEFIHYIQDILLKGFVEDPNYSTRDKSKYYTSIIEMNPWLITSLDDFDNELNNEKVYGKKRVTKEHMIKFINKSPFFNMLKAKDMIKYKKSVKDFYQLVDERIGFEK